MTSKPTLPVFIVLDVANNEVAKVQVNGAGEFQNAETGKYYYYISAGGHRVLFDKADLRKMLAILAGLTNTLDQVATKRDAEPAAGEKSDASAEGSGEE